MGKKFMEETVIKFNNVTKIYKLYKNKNLRLISLFTNKKRYKEKMAISNLTFEVKKGEAVAILGKNGAGKSTIIKLASEITYPTATSIIYGQLLSDSTLEGGSTEYGSFAWSDGRWV